MKIISCFIVILCIMIATLMGCKKNEQINVSPVVPPTDTTLHVGNIKLSDTATILLPTFTKRLSVSITSGIGANKKINWRAATMQ